MEIVFLLLLLLQGTVVGFLCSYVAGQKHRNKLNWFVLGFMFSLLALIALAAIPTLQTASAALPANSQRSTPAIQTEKNDSAQVFIGASNLVDDAYKIWLVERFNITRNDALGGLLCDRKIFPTIEAALSHAHEIYAQEVAHHTSALRLSEDASSTDAEIAHHLGIKQTEDWYIWNGNYFKSLTEALEFAKLRQPSSNEPT